MRLGAHVSDDIGRLMQTEIVAGEKAVTGAAEAAALTVKQNWRTQIQQAGLGRKLANTIRSRRFPETTNSLNAAGYVWSKAPHIVDSHNRGALIGALIGARKGLYMAIPLPAAGKRGSRAGRLSPASWQQRTGIKLRAVRLKAGRILLVADDARLSKSGVAAKNRGRRRKDGILNRAQTVPIFVLVPQVKLPKKLDLYGAAERIADRMPADIVDRWVDQKVGT